MIKAKSCSIGGACGVGFLGLFCPLCIPAFAAVLSAAGLGFLATKEVIWPLLGLFSLILFIGLFGGYNRHHNPIPLILGILGSLAIPIGRYVIIVFALSYVGVAAIVFATVWNLFLQKRSL